MPASSAHRRQPVGALLALVLGAVLAISGALTAVSVGPSGRVSASVTSQAGVVVVGKGVLAASATPARIAVDSPRGGPVSVIRTLDEDAHGVTDGVRRTTITGMSFLPRTLRTDDEGAIRLAPTLNSDIYLQAPVTGDHVEFEVAASRLPQAIVAFSGTSGDVREDPVTVTMAWENAVWFWQAVVLLAGGLALLAWGALRMRRASLASSDDDLWLAPTLGERDPLGPARPADSLSVRPHPHEQEPTP